MIVALTTASLDITLGVAWWTLKQVISGAVYLGTYLFSETSASKKNKILGDDPNFVPNAFHVVELELVHSHANVNDNDNDDTNTYGFSCCSLTEMDKYFTVPLSTIIERKTTFPLWFIPFLNSYPLTNYAITRSSDTFTSTLHPAPIFSPFTLNDHLNLKKHAISEHVVYLRKTDVENTLTSLMSLYN
jgi:hypothetical protein